MESPDTMASREPLDLNVASADELAALEGVEPVLAERIVADRAAAGLYTKVDDLLRVAGVDTELLERLRPHLTVSPPPEADASAGEPPTQEAPPPPEREDDESLLDAEDEDALEAELLAYERLPVSEEELPPLEEEEEPLVEEPTQSAMAEAEAEPAAEGKSKEEPVAQPAAEPTAQPEGQVMAAQAPAQRGGFWRGLLLVLLGGLLGVLLTGLVFMLYSGTLDYAPRGLVTALSRNMDTMQTNQEIAWERLNETVVTVNDLERRLARVEGLADRVADLEGEASAQAEQIETLDAAMDDLEAGLGGFETEMAELDGRVNVAEGELATLGESVDAVQVAMDGVRERLSQFDLFIQALRELLLELDGVTETSS
jgi:competence ComEA-like helix-hairpin-helix protein